MRAVTSFRALALASALGAMAASSGCVHASLGGLAPAGVDLSGQWVLDPAASDDALKLIKAATPAPPKPQNLPNGTDPCALVAPNSGGAGGGGSRRGRSGAGAPQTGPNCPDSGLVATDSGPRLRASDRAQFVRSVVVPADVIEVIQQPDRLVFVQGDRRREFEPGLRDGVSVTDRYGSRTVYSGWSGRDFVVRSEDRSRVSVEEHLHPGTQPATLEVDVTLKAWNYDKIRARAVYRRGDGTAAPQTAADGPPVRGAH